MKKQFTVIFALLFFLFLPVWAEAANQNIYIDSSAAGGGNGALVSPYNRLSDIDWSTLNRWIIGGHSVYINMKKGSVFNEKLKIGASGVSGRPITIQAYGTGNDPIISHSNICIYAAQKDYITIDHIGFTTGDSAGIFATSCDNWSITNCEFFDILLHCIYLSPEAYGGGVNNWTIKFCAFRDTSGGGSGIRLAYWGTKGSANDVVNNLTVTNCTFDNIRCGIQTWHERDKWPALYDRRRFSKNFTITDNIFSNTRATALSLILPGGTNFVQRNRAINIGDGSYKTNAFQLSCLRNALVEYNYINKVTSSGPGDGTAIILDHHTPHAIYASNYNTVRFNYVTGATSQSSSSGISIWCGQNNKIYGNIAVNNATGIANKKAWSTNNAFFNNTCAGNNYNAGCISIETSYCPETTWKNNMFIGGKYAFKLSPGAVYPIEEHNLHYNNTWSTRRMPKHTTSIYGDPSFKDPYSGDYSIQIDSVARGIGTYLGAAYVYGLSPKTVWNMTLPKVVTVNRGDHRSKWDIGAYAYVTYVDNMDNSSTLIEPPKGVKAFVKN